MTPMIDVIFQLIIFFLCTAGFQPPEALLPSLLNLPGSTSDVVVSDPELEDLDEVVVHLAAAAEGTRFEINGVTYTNLTEVSHRLAAVARIRIDLPVILDIDDAVPMNDVIDVYDVCRNLGLTRVQFAAPADA